MTIDVGLTAGICTLWQEQLMFDYTIQVMDHEIPVHKAVMASVSDYFRAMLNGSLLESTTDRVELKGQNLKAVSKLIELVYTGDENIVNNSAMEILGSAVYLQMTFVIQACVVSLVDRLTAKNCLEVLALFVKYSCGEGVKRVKTFLKSNYKSVAQSCNLAETPYEAVQTVIECWGRSEWDLFLFLKLWLTVDSEHCEGHVNDLMSQVRFSLINQGQLEAIMKMEIFTSSDDPWCALVHKAVTYHQKPIHLKIADHSLQAKARGPAVPVVFGTKKDDAKAFYVFKKNGWVKHKTLNQPTMNTEMRHDEPSIEACIEVNNFLIMCVENESLQQWNVFDPRTMRWSQLGDQYIVTGFAMFYHGGKLYTLGGGHCCKPVDRRNVIEYNFDTDKWQEVNKTPSPVMYHAVCVYGDSVYVSGGRRTKRYERTPVTDVNCLDMTTGTWEKKAPMLKALMNHKMNVITLNRQEVIVIIDNETDSETQYQSEISYYQPATDQWTAYDPHFSPYVSYDLKYGSELMFVEKNTVLFINIEQGNEDVDGNIYPLHIPRKKACLQWRFSQARQNISEVNYPKCPLHSLEKYGAILSI